MADEFSLPNILSSDFIKKISPRFRELSPELEREFSVWIEANLQKLFAQHHSVAELQSNLQSFFGVSTAIIDILERIARETEISLKAQLPLVIPSIFKRLKVGEAGFTPSTVETLIRELFRKVRIFQEVLHQQKIDMRQFSVSIPEISRMIDETPLEGFREAITRALLKIEQHRVKLLKAGLTNPNLHPVYAFLPEPNAYALQKVVKNSPQLALAPPLDARPNSRQPSPAMVYSSYYRRPVLASRQPPPVITRYRMVRQENLPPGANLPPAELAAEQGRAALEYNLEVHASLNPAAREREFKTTLEDGYLPGCIGILNRGLNPNKLQFNCLQLICSHAVPSAVRSQLILALCSPSASDAPSLRIPNTLSEEVTQSEYSFLDNLFKRVFYRFTAGDKSICAICVEYLNEHEAVAAIGQLMRLPMHEEGNPYLTALQQILVKLEQSISTIRGRIDKFIDNLPRIKTQIDAINSLNVERDVAFDDTEASLPPRTTAWLRTQYPRQPAVPWSYVTIVRKKPDTNKWIVRDPNRTEDIETAHSGLKTAGSPVWLRVNDSWEEMVIGGESNEEGLWPVRSPGPPNPAGCTFVPYTSLKLHAEDSLKDNTLYTRLKQDSSRISELIANAKQFIEGVKLDYMPKDGVTALLKACEKSSTTLVSALTELGADINLQSTTHLTTPLMNAVKGGNTEVVQLLCSNPGITVDLKDSSDYTALYYAVSTRQAVISQEDIFNIIRILIGAGADPKGRFGTTRKTLLLAAVEYRETPCIEYLLDIPLNPNESDSEGRTPLMIASIRGGTSIIEALLGHGANIDALDALQQNALFYTLHVPLNVAEGRALPAIKYLVEKGIDFRQRNRDGLTIYTWAEANLEINQHRAGYRMDRNILPYLAKLLGCIGGICRAVGIEGLGPNANTRRKRAAERGALAAVAPEALTAVAPVGGSRRKRRTKKRGRSRNRNRNRSRR